MTRMKRSSTSKGDVKKTTFPNGAINNSEVSLIRQEMLGKCRRAIT